MEQVTKRVALIVLGAVLLATLHSHIREHQVPHPHAVKMSLAKRALAPPQLPVVHAAVAVPAAEHPIFTGFVPTPGPVAVPETAPSSCRLRGPPCQGCRWAA
jgi:hypothetical protein